MADLHIKYDSRFAGAKAVANADGAQLCTWFRDHGSIYTYDRGTWAICTGYYYDIYGSSTIYVQTTDGVYLIVDLNDPKWGFTQDVERVGAYSSSQAQKLVNQIIENNKVILQNNLLCARYANLLTSEQQEQVRELQSRLQRRNEALQAEGLVTNVETSYPAGYAELSAYLDKLMKGEQIGVVVSTWVIVVVAAVVVASMGTAAYFAYQAYAKESEQDVKFSKELTKTLTDKLTEEEYQQLLDETKGIVTKSRIKASLSTLGTTAKLMIAAAVAFLGYSWYKKNKGL